MKKISNALTQGTRLRGPRNTYCIQHALGQGTFGITYLATTEMEVIGQMGTFKTTVKVAVKEFFMKDFNGRERAEVTVSSPSAYFVDYKRKFLREAENLSKLQCPHIVKVLESFEANNTAYYAMEYLEGGSLDDYIKLHGALNEGVTVKLAKQIGYALMYMHEHRMLHLDLKPSNVMLRFTGDAVLIDFGLSKQFDKKGVPETSTSLGGGTPGYAPLEQTNYQRDDSLPVTMDVYAFGATIYKMLTGERPPEASEVLNDGLSTFVLERKGVSASMIAVLTKAMSPMRRQRYQTIHEILEALQSDATSSWKEPAASSAAPDSTEETTILQQPQPQKEPRKMYFWQTAPSYVKYGACVAVLLVCVVFLGVRYSKIHGEEELSDEVEAERTFIESDASSASQTITANGVSFKMICVDGGTFTMGATSEQGNVFLGGATPAHRVNLSTYYIGETEVTQALWEAVMGNNPSYFKGANRPVELVSWDDCQTFITKLNSLTGSKFRLPTEAEWEFAARGGNKSRGYKYSGSDRVDDVAWYNDKTTHPVKKKRANELGIYDMSGNVLEWCQDWDGSYSSSFQTNPTGASSGSERVLRGGCWGCDACNCSVAYRYCFTPDICNYTWGFRLVL